jgi:hypothetical protein
LPTSEITTITSSHHAYGSQGDGAITIPVPVATSESQSGSNRHSIDQLSSGRIDNHQTRTGHNSYVEPRPTPGSHSDSQPDHENGRSPNPIPTQGQQSKFQSGHENVQPSVSIQCSPKANNNAEPYPKQGNITQPITSAPRPGTLVYPSPSSPISQGQQAVPTTFATGTVVTDEIETSKSTHSLSSSGLGKAPSKPLVVSQANRYQFMAWTWMTTMIGAVVLFE